MRKVELLGDLAVGESFGGKRGDLKFLRGELVAGVRGATGAGLIGGSVLGEQFDDQTEPSRFDNVTQSSTQSFN
ncbi:hypothetical protein ACQP1G_34795 [Nocardia sp. CA-107356]|uniref:hypothetical protein n=1 Tax=Nocardia sp. CA-107356 TaxID=3239972 RepID=UPI003D8D8AC5